MPTKLIKLGDGLFAEVTTGDREPELSAEITPQKVKPPFESIQASLTKALKSVSDSWDAMDDSVEMERATIELGLGFSAEGNVFFAQGTASANLTVTVSWVPKKAGS